MLCRLHEALKRFLFIVTTRKMTVTVAVVRQPLQRYCCLLATFPSSKLGDVHLFKHDSFYGARKANAHSISTTLPRAFSGIMSNPIYIRQAIQACRPVKVRLSSPESQVPFDLFADLPLPATRVDGCAAPVLHYACSCRVSLLKLACRRGPDTTEFPTRP